MTLKYAFHLYKDPDPETAQKLKYIGALMRQDSLVLYEPFLENRKLTCT